MVHNGGEGMAQEFNQDYQKIERPVIPADEQHPSIDMFRQD
jgi:hypothetical protein